jgi:hypothetical protein
MPASGTAHTATWARWRQTLTPRGRLLERLATPRLLGLVLVVGGTVLALAAYYANQPDPEATPDTQSYLNVADNIAERGKLTDSLRTPGYPLFIALIFAVFGEDNFRALSIAQGLLYVIAAIGVYVFAYLITRRAWIGAIVALLAFVSVYQISYAKAVIVEGFSLWTVVVVLLAVALFLSEPAAGRLWLVAGALLLATMTRPEWLWAAVPLAAFLVLAAASRVRVRRLAVHALLAVVAFYGVVGAYVYANGPENGYSGLVVIPRINLLGKVIQYRMHDDAPARYDEMTRQIDAFLAENVEDPYIFGERHPEVRADHWYLAGEYARAAIMSNPVEYSWRTIRIAHESTGYLEVLGEIDQEARFARELELLKDVSTFVHRQYRYFPLVAAAWLGLWLIFLMRRVEYPRGMHLVCAASLLGLYQLFVVAATGYAGWSRLHTTLNPIRAIVLFGSVLLAAEALARLVRRHTARDGRP